MNISIDQELDIIAPIEYAERIKFIRDNYRPERNTISPITMKIILEKENPIYSSPSRLSPPDQKIVAKQVEQWLKEFVNQRLNIAVV